eukprot:g19997.t1
MFDRSDDARRIVAEVTEWTRHQKQKSHSQYNWQLVPQGVECLGSLDCFYFEKVWFCHFLNHFSNFSRAMQCATPSAASTIRFLTMLRLHGSLTRALLTDQGPEFYNQRVWEFLSGLLIVLYIASSQAHWQGGKNERRIGFIKFVAERCRQSKAFATCTAEEVIFYAITGINELPQAALAGLSPYEVEFCKRPLTSPYYVDASGASPSFFISMEKRNFVTWVVSEAICSKLLRTLLEKKQLPHVRAKSYSPHDVVDFFDETRGWLGPALVVGAIAPGSSNYDVRMNNKRFQKTVSQLRLHRSAAEIDYPHSIQRATRAIMDAAPAADNSPEPTRSADVASRVYDLLFARSDQSSMLYGGYLGRTQLFSAEEKDQMLTAFRAADGEPSRQEVIHHFAQADEKEFRGLLNPEEPTVREISDPVEIRRIREAGHRPVPTLCTRKYKVPGDTTSAKTRICAIGTKKHDHREDVETATPSLSKEILRIIIFFSLCLGYILGSFDVKQAFTQSEPLGDDERVYLLPPSDCSGRSTWRKDVLWQLVRPLYGFRDAGLRWYKTFDTFLLSLGFRKHPYDSAFYFLPSESTSSSLPRGISLNNLTARPRAGTSNAPPDGFLGTVVDDGLFAGSPRLHALIEKIRKRFRLGSQTLGGIFTFSGVEVEQYDHQKFVDTHQKSFIQNMKEAEVPNCADGSQQLYDLFRSLLGSLMWVAYSRPAVLGRISVLSSTTKEHVKKSTIRAMNKLVRFLRATAGVVWRIVPIDLSKFCIICFSDASLNNLDVDGGVKIKTQGGFSIWFGERPEFLRKAPQGVVKKINRGQHRTTKVKANLMHVSSRRIRRVCTSTLQAETVMLVQLIDRAYSLRRLVENVMQVVVPLYIFTDCASIIDHVSTSNVNLTSKRLQIDIAVLREALDLGLITNLVHCPSELNYADELTKAKNENHSEIEKAMASISIAIAFND